MYTCELCGRDATYIVDLKHRERQVNKRMMTCFVCWSTQGNKQYLYSGQMGKISGTKTDPLEIKSGQEWKARVKLAEEQRLLEAEVEDKIRKKKVAAKVRQLYEEECHS